MYKYSKTHEKILNRAAVPDMDRTIKTCMLSPLMMKIYCFLELNVEGFLIGESKIYYTQDGMGIKLVQYSLYGGEPIITNVFVKDE